MKRILVFVVLIFTLLSSGMFHVVLHVCTSSEQIEKETKSCCHANTNLPKCCEAVNKNTVEPSFCCSNIQFYYFTPKFNDGFKKKLNIPQQHFLQIHYKQVGTIILPIVYNQKTSSNFRYPPPDIVLEKNCVWII